MIRKLLIPKQIVTLDKQNRILKNHFIEITNDKISSIKEIDKNYIKNFSGEIFNAENLSLIPGFIQTHVHLCQTIFRGLADDLELLEWLQLKIFPYENAHDKNSLKASIRLGINELLLGGTTTLLDMGTLNHQEIIFDELINSGIRATAGKCMIDKNELFPAFKASTKDELENTYKLAKSFHNVEEGRIKYGFAPRFVLSCSEKLLLETKEMMKDFEGSIFHTHASENKSEVKEIRKILGKNNIEYFDSINLIDEHSVLAHCIHLSEDEIETLKSKNIKVAHCPSSNLKLGSGVANIPRYLKEGISVSLGADGAPCNNNLSQFIEMRFASLIQKPLHGPTSMDAETVFRLATIEGAKVLHLENEVGSIEEGKKADMILIDLNSSSHPLNDENIFSKIVYSSSKENVKHVMVNGEWLVKDSKVLKYDEEKLVEDGQIELKKLLNRV